MIALHCHSHIPISLNLSSSSWPVKPAQISSLFCSKPSFLSKNVHKTRSQTSRRRSDFRDGADPSPESRFFDENGVVKDMDSYLNHLSLEYESVWDTKPQWCQPWTITLTGIGITAGSWLVLNSVIATSVVATVICLWWYIFLYAYPKEYTDMIAERRKKVTSGQEDTYGMETEQ